MGLALKGPRGGKVYGSSGLISMWKSVWEFHYESSIHIEIRAGLFLSQYLTPKKTRKRAQLNKFLGGASMAARNALLKYLRVQIQALPQSARPSPFALSSNVLLCRCSEEVKGCFLDKSEVTGRVISVVKNFQKVDPSKVTPNAHFQNDLGLDSLDAVEIVMALEEEFGFEIPDNEADKINSINLAVDFIASHPQAK